MVNLHVQKDNPKIMHAFDSEDLGGNNCVPLLLEVQKVPIPCWRSHQTQQRDWIQRGTSDH